MFNYAVKPFRGPRVFLWPFTIDDRCTNFLISGITFEGEEMKMKIGLLICGYIFRKKKKNSLPIPYH